MKFISRLSCFCYKDYHRVCLLLYIRWDLGCPWKDAMKPWVIELAKSPCKSNQQLRAYICGTFCYIIVGHCSSFWAFIRDASCLLCQCRFTRRQGPVVSHASVSTAYVMLYHALYLAVVDLRGLFTWSASNVWHLDAALSVCSKLFLTRNPIHKWS